MGKGHSKEGRHKVENSKSSRKGKFEPHTKNETESVNRTEFKKKECGNNNSKNSEISKVDWQNPTIYSTNNCRIGVEDFECMKVIGKGSFGKVMQVRKKDDGMIYAMKILRKELVIVKNQVEHTFAEKSILQKIRHPFIVKLHYAFQNEHKLYMVLDFINGGELFFHMRNEGKFSIERVRFYAAEISLVISYLHSRDIIYRDLKPENILLDAQGHICLTDFGLSKEITPEGTLTFCGTAEYLAPEFIRGERITYAIDWWGLGILIYEMLVGLPPFFSQNANIMYQKILTEELKFPEYIPPEAQSLITELLDRDPKKRLGSNFEVVKQHPFFEGINWDKLLAKEEKAPFIPLVTSIEDTNQIDPEFTSEVPEDSLVERSVLTEVGFDGFTYVGESALS